MLTGKAKIPLNKLRVGVKLPAPIFDARTHVLLVNQGLTLSAGLLEKLRNRGVTSISVAAQYADLLCGNPEPARIQLTPRGPGDGSAKSRTIAIPQEIKRQPFSPSLIQQLIVTRTAHAQQLESLYGIASSTGQVRGTVLRAISIESIGSLSQDIDLFIKLSLSPIHSPAIHEHCLKVAELAMSVAAVLGYSEEELVHLGTGCLISRAGLTSRAKEIMASPRALSRLELTEVRKNPLRTFDLLQTASDVPTIARQVAYQIHERWNGSGYPRGRMGVQIHPLARVAGVCDAFVAMTSPRPFRPPLSTYRANERILADTMRGLFDPAAVRGLFRAVALYPIGSIVRLNDGTVGRVLRSEAEHYDRPVIEPLSSSGAEGTGPIISLVEASDLRVTEVLESTHIADEFDLDLVTSTIGRGGFDSRSAEATNQPDAELARDLNEELLAAVQA